VRRLESLGVDAAACLRCGWSNRGDRGALDVSVFSGGAQLSLLQTAGSSNHPFLEDHTVWMLLLMLCLQVLSLHDCGLLLPLLANFDSGAPAAAVLEHQHTIINHTTCRTTVLTAA
jgi:hypothetical protein